MRPTQCTMANGEENVESNALQNMMAMMEEMRRQNEEREEESRRVQEELRKESANAREMLKEFLWLQNQIQRKNEDLEQQIKNQLPEDRPNIDMWRTRCYMV
ncbi:hypothetical protein VNO80_25328 [Phaseolus coccineus]|uniref:Uncharacterized protein n=1 Tax=Phaseolus coccineus TaxID=3886 RepID=A0AAN9QT87_PHACN